MNYVHENLINAFYNCLYCTYSPELSTVHLSSIKFHTSTLSIENKHDIKRERKETTSAIITSKNHLMVQQNLSLIWFQQVPTTHINLNQLQTFNYTSYPMSPKIIIQNTHQYSMINIHFFLFFVIMFLKQVNPTKMLHCASINS